MSNLSINSKTIPTALANLPAPAPVKSAGDISGAFEETVQEVIDRTNAPLLAKRAAQAAESETAKARILKVGFEQYRREQMEIQKMMKILKILAARANDNIRPHLEHFMGQFRDHPPETVQDMMEYMQSYVSSIQDKGLKKEMEEALNRINRMYYNVSDAELDRLLEELDNAH